ncbi:MAG: DUF2141 domain-containing protein [Pseudomonadota bacterium]
MGLVLAISYGPQLATGKTLTVDVQGIRNKEGLVHIMIYDRATAFENQSETGMARLTTVGAEEGDMAFRFRKLLPGRYAIFVHHDENANNAFDTTAGSYEGYAYSQNVGQWTEPSFSEAAFVLEGDTELAPLTVIYTE